MEAMVIYLNFTWNEQVKNSSDRYRNGLVHAGTTAKPDGGRGPGDKGK